MYLKLQNSCKSLQKHVSQRPARTSCFISFNAQSAFRACTFLQHFVVQWLIMLMSKVININISSVLVCVLLKLNVNWKRNENLESESRSWKLNKNLWSGLSVDWVNAIRIRFRHVKLKVCDIIYIRVQQLCLKSASLGASCLFCRFHGQQAAVISRYELNNECAKVIAKATWKRGSTVNRDDVWIGTLLN